MFALVTFWFEFQLKVHIPYLQTSLEGGKFYGTFEFHTIIRYTNCSLYIIIWWLQEHQTLSNRELVSFLASAPLLLYISAHRALLCKFRPLPYLPYHFLCTISVPIKLNKAGLSRGKCDEKTRLFCNALKSFTKKIPSTRCGK